MKITEFFVRRPVLFWSLMAAILIAGLLSFIQMPKLEDPAVAVKQAMVMVPYPGASAHEVELKVAQMMEDELRALPNVKKVKSECRNGSAMLTVEFQMTVLNRDLEQHFDLLRRKVNDAASRLPEGCYDPVVIDDMMDVYGIFYGLTADGYDYPEMYRYAKYLRRELLDVKGVKRILIAGNRDEVINIILSKEQIAPQRCDPDADHVGVATGLQDGQCRGVSDRRGTHSALCRFGGRRRGGDPRPGDPHDGWAPAAHRRRGPCRAGLCRAAAQRLLR